MPSALAIPAGFVLTVIGALILLAATSRLVLNGYRQRWLRRSLFAALMVGSLVVGGVSGALDLGGAQAFLLFGAVFVGLGLVTLALSWLLPARTGGQELVTPAPAPPAKNRTWVLYLFIAFFVVVGLVDAVQGDLGHAVLMAGGVALFGLVVWLSNRTERTTRAQVASVPPGAGSVVYLRSFPRGRAGRERVVAGYLTPPLTVALQLVEPRRLVDPALPEDDWRTPVATLVRQAPALLMFPDDTAAARWELALIRREAPDRLFVYVPGRVNLFVRLLLRLTGGRLTPWPEFAAALRTAGWEPPPSPPVRCLLGFDDQGRASVVETNVKTLTQMATTALRHVAARPNEGLRET